MKKIFQKLGMTIFPLASVIFIDQFTKNWARSLMEPIYFWKFKLQLVFNNGIILGHFSDLPLHVKEVALITIGTFIFVSYLMSLWLLPIKSKATYLGLSLLVGGIIGNVIDRLNGFSVVDFLSIQIASWQSPFINFADFTQWVGYVFLFAGIFRDSLYYWPKNDWRNKFIINPFFQLRASFLIAALTFFSSITVLIFSFAFLKNGQSPISLKYFLSIGIGVCAFISLFTFLISLSLTHRVAGPVYAIQRHLKDALAGKRVKFKLREHDEFQETETLLNQVSEELPPSVPEDIVLKKVV